jgi:hypothetical protein
MKMQPNRIVSALERLLVESDELLMSFAIVASVGGCIVTIMAVNEHRSAILLLSWLPVAIFFGIRLYRGSNRAAMLRRRWARARVGVEHEPTPSA